MKNIPNILTIFRIILIPIIIVSFYFHGFSSNIIVAFLFALASITDFFDGYLARQFKVQSALGKCLDPIADKLLVILTIVMLINFSHGNFIIIIPGLIIIAREVLVSGFREFLANYNIQMPVSNLAKIKTAIQMGAITLLLLGESGSGYVIDEFSLMIGEEVYASTKDMIIDYVVTIGGILFGLAAFLTIVTGYIYLKLVVQHIKKIDPKS
jgi:CDP-diacylglycerol--glycerol-3-phosphate 3-phosphatidyltransferase|tara:strand:+ start:15783 stop:16415 length:633 start_codon:yes stop_codon:yes gene_type:complete